MSFHVVSGSLTFRAQGDKDVQHAEMEIRFSQPVKQVVAVLTGFEIGSEGGVSRENLYVGLGVTQQQVPSKVAQIHGHLQCGSKGTCHGVVHFSALGIE